MVTLYAATGNDVVQLTSDHGDRWSVDALLTGVGVQCLAIDPHDRGRIYAGTFDHGLFRSHDGGRHWQPASQGIPHGRVLSVAVSACDRVNGAGVVYAGTEPSSLYRSEDGGTSWHDLAALRSLPSAPTWSFPPRPWTSHVRWIAPSWVDPKLLLVGIELGGVMRSIDGGETWEDRKPGAYHDAHALAMHPIATSRVYEAAGGGVSLSDDAGERWRTVDEGMDRHYVWGLAVDPADPDRWYVSATHSARFAHGDRPHAEAIIYRRQGDHPWQPLQGGLPSPLPVMPYALHIPMDQPSQVYAGLRNGDIWRSPDGGETWQQLDVQLPGLLALTSVPD